MDTAKASMKGTTAERSKPGIDRVGLITIAGSTLEWYDFYLFGTAAALVFPKIFFPESSPTAGLLASFAVFASGFIARPFGAVLFGHLGDKFGRKGVLVLTLLLMGLSSTAIGLVPSFDQIGIWAPVILVILRLLGALGAGAELSGAAIFAVEHAGAKRKRGLFGSLPTAGVFLGLILASAAVTAVSSLVPADAFLAWGWRIPFLASVVLLVLGVYTRRRIEETPAFAKLAKAHTVEKIPALAAVRTQWRTILLIIGILASTFALAYLYPIWSVSYATQQLGIPAGVVVGAGTFSSVLGFFVVIAAGAWSDRIGRKRVFIIGAVLSALAAFPFFWLLETRTVVGVFAAMTLTKTTAAVSVGPQGAYLSELFRVGIRFSGFSISREIGSVIFGALPPMAATAAVTMAGGAWWPVAVGVIVVCAISAVSTLLAPETYRDSFLDGADA